MRACDCTAHHEPRRIVLTGGPGAGKTAVLELVRRSLCEHVHVLPESAGIVFGGGFPRDERPETREAAQRAIFYVQRELENIAGSANPAIVLCDRGTVDGTAYCQDVEAFFASVGTTIDEQRARYDAVIHLRTPSAADGFNHENRLRTETAEEAAVLDEKIARAWIGHPKVFVVESQPDFLVKARLALELIERQVPECCREHFTEASGPVLR